MSLTEEAVAQGTRTVWVFSVMGFAHWLSLEAARPNQTPSRKDKGATGARAALSREAATLERDSSVNKPSKEMTKGLPEPRNHISRKTHSHTPGCKDDVVNSPAQPCSTVRQGWPRLAGLGVRSGYTAASPRFPSTCAPRRIKGDNCFTCLLCRDLKLSHLGQILKRAS